mgnify:FL=1
MEIVTLNGENLTIEDIINVAYNDYAVHITEEVREKINDSRKVIDGIVSRNDVKYGITTGFGKFSDVVITGEECKTLQKNLIMSHSCGFGRKFPREIVRTIMLLRANNLARGYSGIRLSVFETLLDMLNKGVHPSIPEKGSLGASGDLAPLAHMVLPMIGEGEAEFKGEILPGKDAMEKAGIPTVELVAKEGLALINGTQVMTAVGSLALYKAINLLKVSDITAALTMEALRGVRDAFDLRTHKLRPHRGQIQTAKNIIALTEGSTFMTDQGDLRVQDAYALRCVPQVHGASKDAVNYI